MDVSIKIKFADEKIKFERVITNLMNQNWRLRKAEETVEYLPENDREMFNWEKKKISDSDLFMLFERKQKSEEVTGVNLYFDESEYGGQILFFKDGTLIMTPIHRKRLEIKGNMSDNTDANWYFSNFVMCLLDMPIEYYQFEEVYL